MQVKKFEASTVIDALKKIKEENIVFARFAFEDLPRNFKQIQSLKFIVIIEGEERAVEFTQINISKIDIE